MIELKPKSRNGERGNKPAIPSELTRNIHKKTVAVLGQKQSGKTVFLRELLRNLPSPIIAIDCVGKLAEYCTGDRSCFLIETRRFDRTTWNLIEAVIAKKDKIVIDIAGATQKEKVDFADKLANALMAKFHKKILILVDEIHEILPEKQGTKAIEFERLVRAGANQGFGVIFTTQRPQSTTKGIVALADVYVLFRIVYGADLDVIKDILKHKLKSSQEVEQALREIQGFNTGEKRIYSFV